MVTRLVKIFENLKNNRQYFVLSSLRGSVGFPGCLKRPFKVSELEHSDQDRCSICVPSDSTFQLFVTGSTSASPAIFLSILAEHNLGI
ncbi:hypothetical protein NC652_037742 [Populus alba x Populus x berolinensis]|nr:hypothetical protein NC652_037742 [Populus alba x Populus x berolinensis]